MRISDWSSDVCSSDLSTCGTGTVSLSWASSSRQRPARFGCNMIQHAACCSSTYLTLSMRRRGSGLSNNATNGCCWNSLNEHAASRLVDHDCATPAGLCNGLRDPEVDVGQASSGTLARGRHATRQLHDTRKG